MIKILAQDYSQAVAYLREKFDSELAKYDLTVTNNKHTVGKFLRDAVSSGSRSVIMVGNVGESSAVFAETFNLSMFYDKFAERNILQYCKLAQVDVPPQHVMDKLCLAPETFNHYASAYGCQCACYGEYNKCQVFLVPDDYNECALVYDNYIYKSLFRDNLGLAKYVFKVFGLSAKDVNARLSALPRTVSRKCETLNLDSKIILTFQPKCSKVYIKDAVAKLREAFGEYLYAAADQTLAQTAVELFRSMGKTLSVAESVTGGMIASSIVDVAGASSVLYEGVVAYTIASKCSRLGINPHFVDEYGVVSRQVAQAMATGLRRNGSDVAVAVTGIAGPASEDGLPIGLCFIGVATEKSVTVYKNVFVGDRNSIRSQAANTALYLACKALTK